MNQLEKSRSQRIVALHNEITNHLKTSLRKAIKVGELLAEQKQSLDHGEFTPWIKDNLPFTDRTAQNYMRLYRERDRLKTETVSDLKSAYKLLELQKRKDQDFEESEIDETSEEYLADYYPDKISDKCSDKNVIDDYENNNEIEE